MLSHHELFLWETNVKDLRIQRMSEMFTFRSHGQRTPVQGFAHIEILRNAPESPTGPLEILKIDAEDLRIHRSSFIH